MRIRFLILETVLEYVSTQLRSFFLQFYSTNLFQGIKTKVKEKLGRRCQLLRYLVFKYVHTFVANKPFLLVRKRLLN